MKHIIIFLCFLLIIPVTAQKINKDYIFYPQENGNLYFIFPQKGFTSENKSDIKGLEYDITYLTTSDSLTISYTYINKEICKPETIAFHSFNNQMLFQGSTEMLFVQPFKQNWKHRGIIKIPLSKATQIYGQELPFNLQIHTNKKVIQYQITYSKWKKQSYLINRVFDIITNN